MLVMMMTVLDKVNWGGYGRRVTRLRQIARNIIAEIPENNRKPCDQRPEMFAVNFLVWRCLCLSLYLSLVSSPQGREACKTKGGRKEKPEPRTEHNWTQLFLYVRVEPVSLRQYFQLWLSPLLFNLIPPTDFKIICKDWKDEMSQGQCRFLPVFMSFSRLTCHSLLECKQCFTRFPIIIVLCRYSPLYVIPCPTIKAVEGILLPRNKESKMATESLENNCLGGN